jgi:hypothetical protein
MPVPLVQVVLVLVDANDDCPQKCAQRAAAMRVRAWTKVARMSHLRDLLPIRSPNRPSEVPTRNERSEVRACWSAFSKT